MKEKILKELRELHLLDTTLEQELDPTSMVIVEDFMSTTITNILEEIVGEEASRYCGSTGCGCGENKEYDIEYRKGFNQKRSKLINKIKEMGF